MKCVKKKYEIVIFVIISYVAIAGDPSLRGTDYIEKRLRETKLAASNAKDDMRKTLADIAEYDYISNLFDMDAPSIVSSTSLNKTYHKANKRLFHALEEELKAEKQFIESQKRPLEEEPKALKQLIETQSQSSEGIELKNMVKRKI